MPGTLFLGLGYELVPFSGAKEDVGMEALVAAHAHMKYDLFMLAASEREWNVPFAEPYPLHEPKLIVRSVREGNLAFVLFPEKDMSEADEERLFHFAEELRQSGRYNLIIGVSSWGDEREQDFLGRRGEVFDMVFGSGEGPGYSGLYLRDNQVLWVRPFTKGKVVLAVTMPKLPEPGVKVVWEPDVSVMVHSYPLTGDHAADPGVEKLFKP